jgi:folate-dependent phosphoribosylglycinamide formyltransferase PurN
MIATTEDELLAEHRLGVFAYNFPHKKTQDFLLKLFVQGVRVHTVLAMDPQPLKLPPSLRTKLRHRGLDHPRAIADRIGAEYCVVEHNQPATCDLIRQRGLTAGIIAGARILKPPVIEAFPSGIVNFHPGLIPEVRGLDALLWSIHNDIALGVTAHRIDRRVDAGLVLLRELIPIYADDTLLDLSERLYETQLELLLPATIALLRGEGVAVASEARANRPMPMEMQWSVVQQAPAYIRRQLRETPLRLRPSQFPLTRAA